MLLSIDQCNDNHNKQIFHISDGVRLCVLDSAMFVCEGKLSVESMQHSLSRENSVIYNLQFLLTKLSDSLLTFVNVRD